MQQIKKIQARSSAPESSPIFLNVIGLAAQIERHLSWSLRPSHHTQIWFNDLRWTLMQWLFACYDRYVEMKMCRPHKRYYTLILVGGKNWQYWQIIKFYCGSRGELVLLLLLLMRKLRNLGLSFLQEPGEVNHGRREVRCSVERTEGLQSLDTGGIQPQD